VFLGYFGAALANKQPVAPFSKHVLNNDEAQTMRSCEVLCFARLVVGGLAMGAVLAACHDACGQSFRRGGVEFNAMRAVHVDAKQLRPVMVTEFYHHGEIAPDGRNMVVVARNQKLVPVRVLQLGPGDFCRLAFQTISGQSSYEILYGGNPPKEGTVPPWTNRDGLLLETRRFKQCNLNRLDSVREAFESAEPIGADYVSNVSHGSNPFSLTPAPFLSRYSGNLHIASAGTYRFWTSSQDCSFLLIDDKPVVAAPGRHGPMRRARRGTGKDIRLSAGVHKFEYYHAAAGQRAIMVAAWIVSPSGPKPRPTHIPSEAFRTESIGRVEAGSVSMRVKKLVPDFRFKIAGDVPLPDNPTALIGVLFKDASPKGLTLKAKARWDFGDGQTSDSLNPAHVYLHGGLYTVTLAIKRGGRTVEMSNRIYVDRQPFPSGGSKRHKLDDYLSILKTYDPRTLDAEALAQLVLTYQWKSEIVLASKVPTSNEDKKKQKEEEEDARARKAESLEYVKLAVAAGKAAFSRQSAAKGDKELVRLARLVSPMARVTLGDSPAALAIWQGALRKVADPRLKAQCAIRAADVAVSDLLQAQKAAALLETAAGRFDKDRKGLLAGAWHRVRGDYLALKGDGKAARESYRRAGELLGSAKKTHVEQSARRGAHSRSTEAFLQNAEWPRAVREIRLWQQDFPADKIDGYLTLLYARYWAGRGKYDQAVSLAEQLIAVNPSSPHADWILLLAAECEVKRGNTNRATATLHSLLKDYPGSPLVPTARKKLAELTGDRPE
jgi:PKD repeat protein